MTRIKICGLRNPSDARAAAKAGADAIGLVFAPSPRQVTAAEAKEIVKALPPFISKVGVFVNESIEQVLSVVKTCGLDVVQLHGQESPQYCQEMCDILGSGIKIVKAFSVREIRDLEKLSTYDVDAFLLDAYVPNRGGGGGQTFPWELAKGVPKEKLILAGGLRASNIELALTEVKPFGVDVSSSVETDGRKDAQKMNEFVEIIRRWEYGK